MPMITDYTTVTRPQRTTGKPFACPACGGLECLCRPRFFAGQLLTEEDLNRLDHYIVAKQKLHNRYLHGWGVVCGLDVVCDGCDSGSVVVRPGYALSPCGEDVIVCGDYRVPVCDLISACGDASKPDCLAPTAITGCDDPIQQWVLAICYAETPSRGVVPLRSMSGCGCSCGGSSGGSASGGCGCGCSGGSTKSGGCGCSGKTNGNGKNTKSGGCGCNGGSWSRGTVATTSASRGASLMQCENTVVCESYGFRVYKAPRTLDRKKSAGALAEAFLACIQDFADAMPTFTPPTTGRQDQRDWCCALQDAFVDWFLNNPGYDCDLAQRIAAIRCPGINDQDFDTAIATASSQYMLGALEILLSCFCTSLMPPCPTAPSDDCVPLAMVTVHMDNGCTVQSICNWTTQRKYVTTFPSLQYWLSILPFGRMLREAIEGLCCKSFLFRMQGDQAVSGDIPGPEMMVSRMARARAENAGANANATVNMKAADVSPSTYFRGSAQTMARSRAFMKLALQSLSSRESSASAEKLVLGMLGEKNAQGEAPLSALESENLLQFLVLDQMAKPTMRNVLGDQGVGGGMIMRTLGAMFGGSGGAADASTSADVGGQLDELRSTVERQQAQINELLRKRPPGKNK